jgi:hypothetical protein
MPPNAVINCSPFSKSVEMNAVSVPRCSAMPMRWDGAHCYRQQSSKAEERSPNTYGTSKSSGSICLS